MASTSKTAQITMGSQSGTTSASRGSKSISSIQPIGSGSLSNVGALDSRASSSASVSNLTPGNDIPITMHNVVATVDLKTTLPLKLINEKLRFCEWNPKRFAACIVRIRDPKVTGLLFASGKMVVTGAKSEEMSRRGARKISKIIGQGCGVNVKYTGITITNMTGVCDVRFPIKLEGMAFSHGKHCHYEPELFPGLIYRMVDPKIVFLIFVSGKVVITGAKSEAQAKEGFTKLYPVLLGFRKE